jgi:hypothetical protein
MSSSFVGYQRICRKIELGSLITWVCSIPEDSWLTTVLHLVLRVPKFVMDHHEVFRVHVSAHLDPVLYVENRITFEINRYMRQDFSS